MLYNTLVIDSEIKMTEACDQTTSTFQDSSEKYSYLRLQMFTLKLISKNI